MCGKEFVSVSIYDKYGYFTVVDDFLLKIIGITTIESVDDVIEKKIYKYNNRFFIKKHIALELNFLLFIDITDELIKMISTSLPMMWVDRSGEIIFANSYMNSKLGFDDIKKYKVYRLASDIYIEDWQRLVNITTVKNVNFKLNFYNKLTDKLLNLNISTNYIKDYDIYQIVISDQTNITEITERLKRDKLHSDRTDELIDSFLSNISHEIRTPMNAIIGYSSIISDYVDDSLKLYSDIVCQNTERLLIILENIISMSKIDSNNVFLNQSTFNLVDIFRYMESIYRNRIKVLNKNVKLIVDIDKKVYLTSDKYLIEECLHKLLDNAVKFTDNGEIHIGYTIEEDKITIYVSDTGIGIESKYVPKIFNRFYKIDTWSMGTGIGLTIFKHYVKLLSGKYDVKSKPEKGSEFSFTVKKI